MPTYCNIKVRGYLDPSWSIWFDQFMIKYDDYGQTTLSGIVVNHMEWIGLLENIHDSGLRLVSIFLGENLPGEVFDADHPRQKMNRAHK